MEHILIVDDNEAGRYLKARVLAKAGYEIAEAATGQAARELLRKTDFALVLLDVKLPDVSGIDLAREIKHARTDVVILQTSAAFISQHDRAAGLAGGADSYLIEPIDPVELVATVESLLRRYRAERDLREKHETLEQAVAERGEQIAEIGARLQSEMGLRIDAEEMLRHAQKLDVLGQLTGGIAHDFNNVLTIIMGNLESLRRQLGSATPDLARARTQADGAFYGAKRAVAITRQLLAFSRKQTLAPRVLDVNAFVANLAPILRQVLGEKITAEVNLSKELWPVMCDADQLETVLLNLAINARDAMSKGGTLTISTENRSRGNYAVVTVRDTGTGMSADVLKYAFEPFFTTKDIGQGTGLGLSQVHGFMRQSGGTVEIDSAPGRGTAVMLFFPRYAGAEVAVGPGEAASREVANGKSAHRARILVVEDDPLVRSHSGAILREMGHTVIEAVNGQQAIDLLRAHPEIDLMFTDVGLAGGMSGPELGRNALAARPGLKILYTTGYDRERLKEESLEDDAAVLTKPFTYGGLAEHIDRLMAGCMRSGAILMIEDEAMIRMDTAMTLRDMGFEVVEAASMADGLYEINTHGDEIGAVVVDIGLPDGRGDDLVTKLRITHEKIPVIITTGYEDPALHAKFDRDGCIKFLSKPYFPDEVANTLRNMGVGA